jgi:TonB family protein
MDKIENEIKRYINGEMSPAERYRLEKKALSDSFLADALEGASIAGPENFATDAKDLELRLSEKQTRKSWFTPMRIAASVSLLLIGSFILYTTFFRSPKAPAQLATLNSTPTPAVPTAPIKHEDSVVATHEEKSKQNLLSINQPPSLNRKKESAAGPASSSVAASESEAIAPPPSKPSSLAGHSQDTIAEEEIIDVAKQITAAPQPASRLQMEAKSMGMKKSNSVAGAPAATYNMVDKVSKVDQSSSRIHVAVKGTSISSQTDARGNYVIPPSKNKATQSLIFSLDGFQTTEVDANEQSNINIQLSDGSGRPAEVVVGNDLPSYNRFDLSTVFAEPVGGNKSFDNYLEKSLQYPHEAIEKKIQGKVLVSFMLKKDSTLSDFNVLHGIGYGCDEELIRLIKEGPKWAPLRQSDNQFDSKVYVRYKFVLPK